MSNGPMLFLCWSGHRSKRVAECFEDYFDSLFRATRPPRPRVAMSETLIEKGAPWSAQLLKDLEDARAGIVCLTPENRSSAWLHFEGGALAGRGGMDRDATARARRTASKLFCFLFTMDNTRVDGPLSLFQATAYRRDYDRDREELLRLTRAVVGCFDGCASPKDDERLSRLVGKLRELQFLAFRDVVPGLEGHVRPVIQAVEELGLLPARIQALSAMRSLQRLLEDRQRHMEVVCAPAQLMFFERLVEVLSAASRGLERTIAEGSDELPRPLEELVGRLRRMLEIAVEPLVPVLDDAWRYALYGLHGRQEAFRKQKLLLVNPLESTLQRAELETASIGGKARLPHTVVPRGHLLSRNEQLRALRSFWAYDRVAAYIHYCEDVSRPISKELERMLRELTRAVLKEISLVEVAQGEEGRQERDDLPLRFAVRALILKVKVAIGYGSYGSGRRAPGWETARVRALIESRIRGETGLSFEGLEELVSSLRKLNDRIGARSAVDLKPPLVSLCDDLDRLLGSRSGARRLRLARLIPFEPGHGRSGPRRLSDTSDAASTRLTSRASRRGASSSRRAPPSAAGRGARRSSSRP